MLVSYVASNDVIDVDKAPEAESEKLVTSGKSSQKLPCVDKSVEKDKGKGK